MLKSGEISPGTLRSYEEKIGNLSGIGQAVITVREVSEPSSLKTVSVLDLVPNLPAQKQFREQADGSILLSASQQDKDSGVGPPAISHGGDLRESENAPRSLSETLKRAAERAPHRGIVYINKDGSEDFQPYLSLLSEYKREYGFKLFAYALLPKSLYLLIELR